MESETITPAQYAVLRQHVHQAAREWAEFDFVSGEFLTPGAINWRNLTIPALCGELAPCVECGEWAPTHGECPNGHRADATEVPCPEGCENGEIRHAEVDASGCYEGEPTTCETCGGRGTIPADETDPGWLRIYFLRALAHVRAHGFDLEVRL